jgi:SNF2 family DNA or RNA helicase
MGVGLRGLMSRVQLRRRRAEVLDDLPPKFASVIGLDLTATQRAAYRKAEEKGTVWLRSLGRELRISHVLELILRLKQICNFCPETGDSAKLHDLRDRLQEFSASEAKASPSSSRNHSACGDSRGNCESSGRWPSPAAWISQPAAPHSIPSSATSHAA